MKNKSPFQEHCQTGTTVPAGLPLFLIGGIFMLKPILIEDLGMIYANENSKQKTRHGIYECPLCHKIFRCRTKGMLKRNVKSCGCYRKQVIDNWVKTRIPWKKHGLSGTKIFGIWCHIIERCHKPYSGAYKNYGGRGITVCDEWRNDFMSFYNWAMANGYIEPISGKRNKIEIDRENVNGNYEPSNCRFTTRLVNGQNTRLLLTKNKSGYRGVCRRDNVWIAQITNNGIKHRLGRFKIKEEAVLAYNNFVIEHKTNHPLNIIL